MELEIKQLNDDKFISINIDGMGKILIPKLELINKSYSKIEKGVGNPDDRMKRIINSVNSIEYFAFDSHTKVLQSAILTALDSLKYSNSNRIIIPTLQFSTWIVLLIWITSLFVDSFNSWWLFGSLTLSLIMLIIKTYNDPLVGDEADEGMLIELHERGTTYFSFAITIKTMIEIYFDKINELQ